MWKRGRLAMEQKDIWLVNLEPVKSNDIKEVKPCVLFSDEKREDYSLKVIAPLTDFQEEFEIKPWVVKIVPDDNNNLVNVTAIDLFQIRVVEKEHFIKKTGSISDDDFFRVLEALSHAFELK